jgi:hypothetical protein
LSEDPRSPVRDRAAPVIAARLAALLALAFVAFYLALLVSEGEGDATEPVPIAFSAAICLAAVALVLPARPRLWFAAAGVLAACAVLSGFTIGLLLLPAVVLALLAAARA